MGIKRHRRKLTNGEERTYIYGFDGEKRRSRSVVDGSVSPKLYRTQEKNRIAPAAFANSSELVESEPGCGKSALGQRSSQSAASAATNFVGNACWAVHGRRLSAATLPY